MKRSEMIEKIEFALSQIAYAESIDRKKFESEYIANRVLEVCEEAGMKPPEAEIKEECRFMDNVYRYVKKCIWEKE